MHTRFTLPEELTIYTLAEQHPLCVAWADMREPATNGDLDDIVRVDAAAVAEVDAAGVQLLLSLANALALQRRTLRLDNPSPPLASACAALGVSALLTEAAPAGVAP